MNNSHIKIVLAILLFVCLSSMPYGYYQLIRFVMMIGFTYLAYFAYKLNQKNEVFIYIGLAVLFQPLVKVALGRIIWNIVDLIVGISLIISILKTKKITK